MTPTLDKLAHILGLGTSGVSTVSLEVIIAAVAWFTIAAKRAGHTVFADVA